MIAISPSVSLLAPHLLMTAGLLFMMTAWFKSQYDRFRTMLGARSSLRQAFHATKDDGLFDDLIARLDVIK